MRTLASLLTLMLATVLASPSAHAEAAVPRPFSATYAVTYRGIGAGTITFDFARDAATDRYIYETHASPSTLARLFVSKAAMERSVMEIDASGTRPIEWRLDDGKSGNEDDGELHFGLATAYRRQRKTDEAIAEYEVAVQKNPRLAKAYYDLGLLYSQDKKNAEARAAFEKYLQYGTNEDAASRKDAEERLKTFKK